MSDHTTITVSPETKRLLDDHRDGETWDAYLRGLVADAPTPSETVRLETDQADEIARMAAKKVMNDLDEMVGSGRPY